MQETVIIAASDFTAIADSVPHLAWTSRADGFTDYVNRRMRDYAGTPCEAASGWGWLELVHPDDREHAKARWEGASRTGRPYECEYRLRDADGTYRWMLARAEPVRGADGRVTKWIGTWTASTRREGDQEQRLTPRELEIVRLAADGHSGPTIAQLLVVSPSTVKTHFENIYEKLGVGDRVAAVAVALRSGLID